LPFFEQQNLLNQYDTRVRPHGPWPSINCFSPGYAERDADDHRPAPENLISFEIV